MFIIIFVVILTILVIVHEFGHFIIAKKSGITVHEFAIGFPPTIFRKTWRGTEYKLNLIPFGGYVKIEGENAEVPERTPGSLSAEPRPIQALVLLGGIICNIIFAWALISIGFMIGMPTSEGASRFGTIRDPRTVIVSVMPASPAEQAGLKSGDQILSIQYSRESLENLSPAQVSQSIASSNGEEMRLSIKRGTETLSVPVVAHKNIVSGEPERYAIGVATDRVGILRLPVHLAFLEGTITTAKLVWATITGITALLFDLVTFHGDFSYITGPVGIASTVGEAGKLGFVYLLSLTALISINLAIVNLVPFPALDGGRLLFVVIESITRRSLPVSFVRWTNTVGFCLLLLLMFLVTKNDIVRLL